MRKRLWDGEGNVRAGAVFLVLFALLFLRCCCYGLQYFPQLDDYIQHHNYAAYHSDLWQLILGLGVLASRPAAGVLDIVFWSRLWPVMILGVALISALYAASAVLFRQVWRKYFSTGWVFLVLYALLPLGMEGTYWMSASTRVVPGLFFTALAMWLFQRWCGGGRRRDLALYFLAQLASFLFYEQDLVLSITGVILVGLLEVRVHRRRALGALLTFVNVAIYFGFTSIFSQSVLYSGRTAAVLPWQEGWWSEVFLRSLRQMWSAFFKGGVYTAGKGLFRGARLTFTEGHWFWLVLVLALCALVFLLARERREEPAAPEAEERSSVPAWEVEQRRRPARPGRTALALVVGFLMALAPVSIFFILKDPWFSLRGTVPSFCGLALMADALVGLLLRRLRRREAVTAAVCAALALVFSLAALSEVHDYKVTYENDQRVLSALCAATLDGAALPRTGDTVVLGIEPSYLEEQNFYFHEHIHGVTESRWALTGALQCVSGNAAFPFVKPLPSTTIAATLAAEEYAALYLYDPASGNLYDVTAQLCPDGNFDLRTADGTLLGRVTAEGLHRSEA